MRFFGLFAVVVQLLSLAAAQAQSPFDQEVSDRQKRFAAELARPGSAAAVIPVLGLSARWDDVTDRTRLRAVLSQMTKPQPALSELVRAEALWHDQVIRRHVGDDAGLQDVRRQLGLLRSFAVVGPFDNDGRKGHKVAYPPEKEGSAPGGSVRYPGKSPALPLSWRVIPEAQVASDGAIPLDAWLRPETEGTAYAQTYVKSPSKQAVAVRVGSTGAVKVFVNQGAAVIDRDVYRKLHLDQEVGLSQLQPGWNRILVKVSSQSGRWAFVLRLTSPDGRALTGLEHSATPPQEGWPFPAALPSQGPKPQSLLALLRARVPSGPSVSKAVRSAALMDLGLFLHHVQPVDPELREAESVLREAISLQASRRGYRLLADATEDDNQRRLAIDAGLLLPGSDEPVERALLLVEHGSLLEQGSRLLLAEQAFAEAERILPSLYTARLGLARIAQSRGMPSWGYKRIASLKDASPSMLTLQTYAELLARMGRQSEAESAYQAILKEQPDDDEALRFLISRRRAAGQLDEALQLIDRLQKVKPDAHHPLRERLDLLEGAGRYEEALVLVSGAMVQLVGDPDWYERRGRVLQRLGRIELAVASYRRSLELKPQNPTLREYVQALDPAARSAEDLQRQFQVDVETLLKKPRPPVKAGDTARVLLDQKVVRIHTNGLSEEYNQRIVEILDENGSREYDEVGVSYTPDTQSVQVKTAKVIRSSGEVVESVSQSESDASEPWYGLYYDLHALTIRFDSLRPGDVVIVEYVRSDVGRRNLFSDYFGDVQYLQEGIPVLEARYVLTLPEEDLRRRPLYFNQPRIPRDASIEQEKSPLLLMR